MKSLSYRMAVLAVLVTASLTFAQAPALAQGSNDVGRTVVQFANMHDADNNTIELAGAGILTRGSGRVDVSLHMTGLDANGAYTSWWIVFNRPHLCTDSCGFDDLEAGIGQGFYATGYIADAGGIANVYASLPVGPVPEGVDRLSQFVPGLDPTSETGLAKALDAEIHVITARSHGEVLAGDAAAQIGSLVGGCDLLPDGCVDQQAVAFLPPDG